MHIHYSMEVITYCGPKNLLSLKISLILKNDRSCTRQKSFHLPACIDCTFTPQILILTHKQWRAFENIVENGEIARKEQFLLFPHFFLLNQIIVSPFVHIFDIISLFATELEDPKIGILGK